ncbi:hypothetical protein VTI28DRAFT_10304 [Corynascus sepedonium]
MLDLRLFLPLPVADLAEPLADDGVWCTAGNELPAVSMDAKGPAPACLVVHRASWDVGFANQPRDDDLRLWLLIYIAKETASRLTNDG